MSECTHAHTRFLSCSAGDRFPGVFVCDQCGTAFSKDPNNPNSVEYLSGPSERHTKTLPEFKQEEHKGKQP